MIGLIVLLIGIGEASYGVMYSSIEMLVFGIVLLLAGYQLMNIYKNTPAGVFLNARRKKSVIVEMERNDGTVEFITPEYAAGCVIDDKYGVFGVDQEGIKTERKSRIEILHCLEGIGTTINRKLIAVIRAVKSKYNVRDYNELMSLVSRWGICTSEECKYEGAFKVRKIIVRDKETGDEIKTKYEFECPKCGKKEIRLKEPDLSIDAGRNIEAGWVDKYFRENQNPILKNVNAKKLAMNELEKEKGIPVKTLAIIMSLAMAFVIIVVALVILYNSVGIPSAQAAGEAVGGIILGG